MKGFIFRSIAVVGLMSLALVGSSGAQAAPNRLMKRLSQAMPAKKSSVAERGMCANFSGSWVGTCTDSTGDTSSDWLNIEQYDCGSVSIQGDGFADDLPIGGMIRLGSTSFVDSEAWDVSATADWDIARRVVTVRGVAMSKITSLNITGTVNGVTTYALVNDQLKTRNEYKGEGFRDGVPTPWDGWEECTYDKRL